MLGPFAVVFVIVIYLLLALTPTWPEGSNTHVTSFSCDSQLQSNQQKRLPKIFSWPAVTVVAAMSL